MCILRGPGGTVLKHSPANAGDAGLIPGSGRYPGRGHGNPVQYSCLGNPMDREACRATVHRVTRSRTSLSMHACICVSQRCMLEQTGFFHIFKLCIAKNPPCL